MDNKIFSSKLKAIVLTIGLSTLISCGGGGGDGDDPKIVGLPGDFDLFAQSGTWKTTIDFDTTTNLVFSSVEATIDADISLTTVSAFNYNSDNDITGQSCDEFGPQQVDTSDFEGEFFDEDIVGACANSETRFTTLSDSNYQVDFFCDDVKVTSVGFEKLSDASLFDFGSLSFTSDDYADLDTNSGVCGDRSSIASSSTYTPQPNEFNLENGTVNQSTISVAAPYAGSYILFYFNFYGDVSVNTYAVVYDSSASDGDVAIELSSVAFGGTPTSPAFVDAETGIVTITSVGASSAAGSFDIVTDAGDTMVGSFSFDLQ